MCQKVNAPGAIEIETIGQLRRLMPRLVKDPGYTATPDPIPESYNATCLCPVDISATAAANGFVSFPDAGDFNVVAQSEEASARLLAMIEEGGPPQS
jgi:hypothetical protein